MAFAQHSRSLGTDSVYMCLCQGTEVHGSLSVYNSTYIVVDVLITHLSDRENFIVWFGVHDEVMGKHSVTHVLNYTWKQSHLNCLIRFILPDTSPILIEDVRDRVHRFIDLRHFQVYEMVEQQGSEWTITTCAWTSTETFTGSRNQGTTRCDCPPGQWVTDYGNTRHFNACFEILFEDLILLDEAVMHLIWLHSFKFESALHKIFTLLINTLDCFFSKLCRTEIIVQLERLELQLTIHLTNIILINQLVVWSIKT